MPRVFVITPKVFSNSPKVFSNSPKVFPDTPRVFLAFFLAVSKKICIFVPKLNDGMPIPTNQKQER